MAFQESDREDLMQEATALVDRIELKLSAEGEAVIAGYRRNGSLSLFFGADPVYHFDQEMRLKRAYLAGFLFRTQGSTLARLERVRTVNPQTNQMRTELHRHDLTSEELEHFQIQALSRLSGLQDELEMGAFEVQRQVSGEANLIGKISGDLMRIIGNNLPLAPRFKGKR
ncbi:MAG: hypothetical protein KDA65_12565 [Planctomycetaceae bacterium]|nr:hypothetical protein [Planctomycetaceae bacterium]